MMKSNIVLSKPSYHNEPEFLKIFIYWAVPGVWSLQLVMACRVF